MMVTTGDPDAPGARDYVVPLPRVTDALGVALGRVYVPAATPDHLIALLRRLDTRQ